MPSEPTASDTQDSIIQSPKNPQPVLSKDIKKIILSILIIVILILGIASNILDWYAMKNTTNKEEQILTYMLDIVSQRFTTSSPANKTE